MDVSGQPTNGTIPDRRRSDLITQVPKPKKRRKDSDAQGELIHKSPDAVSDTSQDYSTTLATK